MNIFKQALGDISGGSVLDIATQEGGFVRILMESLQSYTEIIGIDISEQAIATAQSKFDQKNIRFMQMDAAHLSFADERFDTVSLSASLHHLANIPQVLAEAMRVLKTGGHFILAEMHRDGQTEAQLTMVYLHHWVAAVDSALGIFHNSTLPRQKFVDTMAELGLHHTAVYDFSDPASDPMDAALITQLDDLIDKNTQRAAGVQDGPALMQRGQALQRRLHKVGIQREPLIVIVGEKGGRSGVKPDWFNLGD